MQLFSTFETVLCIVNALGASRVEMQKLMMPRLPPRYRMIYGHAAPKTAADKQNAFFGLRIASCSSQI
jgi:hypothetical protein